MSHVREWEVHAWKKGKGKDEQDVANDVCKGLSVVLVVEEEARRGSYILILKRGPQGAWKSAKAIEDDSKTRWEKGARTCVCVCVCACACVCVRLSCVSLEL